MVNNRRNTLEDVIRGVQQKYRNRPSPLKNLYESSAFAPSQLPQMGMPMQNFGKPQNPRDALLGGFRPSKDTFR